MPARFRPSTSPSLTLGKLSSLTLPPVIAVFDGSHCLPSPSLAASAAGGRSKRRVAPYANPHDHAGRERSGLRDHRLQIILRHLERPIRSLVETAPHVQHVSTQSFAPLCRQRLNECARRAVVLTEVVNHGFERRGPPVEDPSIRR